LAPLVALAMLALDARAALAATLCVNPAGSGGCFASVQQAVDAATSGDVIAIAAGTYAERVEVPPRKRSLALQGEGAATTRLVTPAGGFAALSVKGPATFVAVSGLTLASETSPTAPGVVSAAHGARLTIADCVVAGGRTGVSAQAKVEIRRSTITGASTRGLIVDHTGSLTVSDSTVTGNFIGIDVAERSATVVNSTISGNSTVGISVWGPIPPNRTGGSLKLTSSTVAANGITGIAAEGRATLAARAARS